MPSPNTLEVSSQILAQILADYGEGLIRDERRLRSLLADLLPADTPQWQQNTLLSVAKHGIAGEIWARSNGQSDQLRIDHWIDISAKHLA